MALFLTCHTACPFYSSFIKRHDLGWGPCYHSANTGEADCCLWVCHITPVRKGVDVWAVFYKQENYPQRDWFLYQLLSHPALLKALWTSVCSWVSATDNERMWSLVVKIQVMNVENNSVNEILFGRHLTLRSLLSQPLVLQILLVWGMHSFEQNSSALHPTSVLCIQVDPFIWALWSRLRVKTLEAGKPLSKPGNIPSRLYRLLWSFDRECLKDDLFCEMKLLSSFTYFGL